jgi:hypothetical protein
MSERVGTYILLQIVSIPSDEVAPFPIKLIK